MVRRILFVLLALGTLAVVVAGPAEARIARKVTTQSLYPRYVTQVPQATLKHNVQFHRQEHSLSCEAAGLRMLLLFEQIDEPENWIIGNTPFGPMGADPDYVFVGNIDGRTQLSDGYGIHWDAMAHVAAKYRPAEAFHRQNLEFLIDRLHDGRPVLVWGSMLRNATNASWVTPEGKYVHAVRGQHVWVVTGYAGSREKPTHIFTLDPLYGQRVFRTGDFLGLWNYYNNSGMFLKDPLPVEPSETVETEPTP